MNNELKMVITSPDYLSLCPDLMMVWKLARYIMCSKDRWWHFNLLNALFQCRENETSWNRKIVKLKCWTLEFVISLCWKRKSVDSRKWNREFMKLQCPHRSFVCASISILNYKVIRSPTFLSCCYVKCYKLYNNFGWAMWNSFPDLM
jgi:hypothetical protein